MIRTHLLPLLLASSYCCVFAQETQSNQSLSAQSKTMLPVGSEGEPIPNDEAAAAITNKGPDGTIIETPATPSHAIMAIEEQTPAVDELKLQSTPEAWQNYNTEFKKQAEDITNRVRVEEITNVESDYSYSSFGKPDPFIPPMITDLISQLEIEITSPLQNYLLEELGVVGIWMFTDKSRKALIMTKDGEGIIVKKDDPIGKAGGRITAIESNKVVVREFFPAPDGTRQFRDYEMFLGGRSPGSNNDKIVISTKTKDLEESQELKGYLDRVEAEKIRNQRLMDQAYNLTTGGRVENVDPKMQEDKPTGDPEKNDDVAIQMELNPSRAGDSQYQIQQQLENAKPLSQKAETFKQEIPPLPTPNEVGSGVAPILDNTEVINEDSL